MEQLERFRFARRGVAEQSAEEPADSPFSFSPTTTNASVHRQQFRAPATQPLAYTSQDHVAPYPIGSGGNVAPSHYHMQALAGSDAPALSMSYHDEQIAPSSLYSSPTPHAYAQAASSSLSSPPSRSPLVKPHQLRSMQTSTTGSRPAYNRPSTSHGLRQPASSVSVTQGNALQARHGIPLTRVSELPDRLRVAFGFPLFNAIQSICFDAVYKSDENIAVSAPTGSGKTVLFELAIMRMLTVGGPDSKAVYVAPTKALCAERAKDWIERLQPLGCPVVELTGDTDRAAFAAARKSRVIITTPEKWDSLTRSWQTYAKILDRLELFLVDEVHTLHEKERGARLETIIARTQTFGKDVRFVAVSATVPNLCDIATWLGARRDSNHQQQRRGAQLFEFGEEYRPCPLHKHVYGYPSRGEEWGFQSSLNSKLLGVLRDHAHGKPSLVFCPTRKATGQAARAIKEDYAKLIASESPLPWSKLTGIANYTNADLQGLAEYGIAVHHAGLPLEDRRTVCKEFLAGRINALCCTSTLAIGVNLPAYCVVIRGTKRYEGSEWTELTDLDLIQMLGRAGRPAFDTEGTAVILTEQSRKRYYEELASGKMTIESTLHLSLVEMINSEIGLRNGRCTVEQLIALLRKTFLFVRMKANPQHYMAECDTRGDLPPEETLDMLCRQALAKLEKNELIARGDGQQNSLALTELGDILLRTCVSFETLLLLLKLRAAKVSDLLSTISQAREFADLRLRQEEKPFYSSLRTNAEIRCPPAKVVNVADKVNLIIQATLAGVSLQSEAKASNLFEGSSTNATGDLTAIFKNAPRILRAASDVAIAKIDAVTLQSSLELARSLNGKAWDNSAVVLRQLDNIGEKSIKVLASAGIHDYGDVARAQPHRLELLLKRNPPFGHRLCDEAASLPELEITIEQQLNIAPRVDKATGLVTVPVNVAVYAKQCPRKGVQRRFKSKRDGQPYHFTVLTMTSDGEQLIDFRKAPLRGLLDPETGQGGAAPFHLECKVSRTDQKVIVLASCEEIAGSQARADLELQVDAALFPEIVMAEERQRGHSIELDGLEDCSELFRDELSTAGGSNEEASDEVERDLLARDAGSSSSHSRVSQGIPAPPPSKSGPYPAASSSKSAQLASSPDQTGVTGHQRSQNDIDGPQKKRAQPQSQAKGKKKKRAISAEEEAEVMGGLQRFIHKSRQAGSGVQHVSNASKARGEAADDEEIPAGSRQVVAPALTAAVAKIAKSQARSPRRSIAASPSASSRPIASQQAKKRTQAATLALHDGSNSEIDELLSPSSASPPSTPPSPGRLLKPLPRRSPARQTRREDLDIEAARREAEAELQVEEARDWNRMRRSDARKGGLRRLGTGQVVNQSQAHPSQATTSIADAGARSTGSALDDDDNGDVNLHRSSEDFDNEIDWSLVGDHGEQQRSTLNKNAPFKAKAPAPSTDEDDAAAAAKQRRETSRARRRFLRSSSPLSNDAPEGRSEGGLVESEEEEGVELPLCVLVDGDDAAYESAEQGRREEASSRQRDSASSEGGTRQVASRHGKGSSPPSSCSIDLPAHTLVDDHGGRTAVPQKQHHLSLAALAQSTPVPSSAFAESKAIEFDDSEEAWDRYLEAHVG